jgi:hypothetical protein
MDPIDYTSGFPNPLNSFTAGLQLGATTLDQQAKRDQLDAAQAARDAAAKKQAEIDAVLESLRKPGATYDDWMKASILFGKDQGELMQKAATGMRDEERTAAIADSAKILAALRANRTDIAIDLLRKQGEAERASNNEKGAQWADTLISMAEKDPEALQIAIGIQMGAIPGSKDAFDAISKNETERREAADFPVLHAQKQEELSKATSDAQKAEIEAKYAEQFAIANLAKIDAEIQKMLSEANKAGGVTPEQKASAEDSLRKELAANQTGFRVIEQGYNTINSAAESGVGDMARVYSIMKMFDPGSAVREGEYATAATAGGVPSSIIGVYNSLVGGGKLSPQMRKDIIAQAQKLYDEAKKRADNQRQIIKNIAERRGLDINNILLDLNPASKDGSARDQPVVTGSK